MSDDRGYRPGGTVGGRCGCVAAALPGLVLGPFWLLAMTLGDCFADDPCRRNQNWDMVLMIAILAGGGALFGFSVRALINWMGLRTRDPAGAGWPPFWAIAGLLAAAAAMDWWMKV